MILDLIAQTKHYRTKIVDNQDWVLLVINAAGDGQLSPVQMQKGLFLLKEKLPNVIGETFYKFEPGGYGPFCAEIFKDAGQMGTTPRLVHTTDVGYKLYSVSPLGRERSLTLEESLEPVVTDYIHKVVEWVMRISFARLMGIINKEYPTYAVNSVFHNQYPLL